MNVVNADSIGASWVQAMECVMENGASVRDGDQDLLEVLDLFVDVTPAEDDVIIRELADPEMVSWMVEENFGGTKPVKDWGYCYGMRLHGLHGVDQVAEVTKKLRKNPDAKSATLSLFDTASDFTGHMPCITTLDFKLRDGKLHITGFFRSQDIGKKLYADILALKSIQDEMAGDLGVASGRIKVFVASAHIYMEDAEKVKSTLARAAELKV